MSSYIMVTLQCAVEAMATAAAAVSKETDTPAAGWGGPNTAAYRTTVLQPPQRLESAHKQVTYGRLRSLPVHPCFAFSSTAVQYRPVHRTDQLLLPHTGPWVCRPAHLHMRGPQAAPQ